MPNISISGKTTDGEDVANYWLNLYANDGHWEGGDSANPGKVLSATNGKWVYKAVPDKGVYAMDANGAVVIFFRNLEPRTAAVGQTGNGNANGTGRTISWRVDSL